MIDLRPATILVAAYGTARPGYELHNKIRGSIVSTRLSRIMGTMYKSTKGNFPIADLSSGHNTLVTTTLEMKLDALTCQFISMEIREDYEPVWVDELSRDTSEPTGHKVLAFDFVGELAAYGDRVPSGDWNESHARPTASATP